MKVILGCPAPPQSEATLGSFFDPLDLYDLGAFGKKLAIVRNAFLVSVYHRGIPRIALTLPSVSLTAHPAMFHIL
jgi:hypothetical protein